MNITKKCVDGFKISEVSEIEKYSWFIDYKNKTFSLTKVSETTKYTTIKELLEEGFTYVK